MNFIKSRNKQRIVSELKKRGFTANSVEWKLFFWRNDGWYLHCDQVEHYWIGQNVKHCIEQIQEGCFDKYLKESGKNYIV